MMAADSLRFIVPSGVSPCWLLPRHRVCSADASALHLAQPTALPSHVQASCLERARPVAVAAFADGLAAGSTAPPGRQCPERKREAKAEGKIKGRGTYRPQTPVCTRAWRGTRQVAARCCACAQTRAATASAACHARRTAPGLYRSRR